MELKINNVKPGEFQAFIKKLIPVDQFISMKISSKSVSSAVHFPQRDAVKVVSIETSSIFELDEPLDTVLKVSFYNANRIIDALSYFGDSKIKGKIVYKVMKTNDTEEFIATDFIIYNDELTIDLFCADPALSFMDMQKEDLKRAFNIDTSKYKFVMDKKSFEKFNPLFKLDKEQDTFKILLNGQNVNIKGNNYNALISTNPTDVEADKDEVMVYKKYLPLIDKEDHDVAVCANKVFFKSKETNTLLIIAICCD